MSDLAAPKAHYTHRIVSMAVRLVAEDGMPYEAASRRLRRDHRVFVPWATIQKQSITPGLPHLRALREIKDKIYRLFDRRCRTDTALAKLRQRVRRFHKVGDILKKLQSPNLEKALTLLHLDRGPAPMRRRGRQTCWRFVSNRPASRSPVCKSSSWDTPNFCWMMNGVIVTFAQARCNELTRKVLRCDTSRPFSSFPLLPSH